MLSFIIFILATIGATFIITQSYVFRPLRKKVEEFNPALGKLVKCTQCCGFYIGIINQFVILIHERAGFIFYYSDWYYIIYGFIGSFICYLTYLLIRPLMDKYD